MKKHFCVKLLFSILVLLSMGCILTACEGSIDEDISKKCDHNWVEGTCAVCGLQITPNEYFTFTLLDDDTYEIAAKDINNIPDKLVIPFTYNDKPVSSIGVSAFDDCNNLNFVEISNSVTSIGKWAFYECDNLISVIIPNSVTDIGDSAFEACKSLTTIEIPSSVTEIGWGAFFNCSSLTNITVSENNPNYSSFKGDLYNKEKTRLIQYAIGKKDETFTIPNTVTSIEVGAFGFCTLTSIEIPNTVTSIDGAFAYSSNLASIVISNGVKNIGYATFCECLSLTSIVIPNSVTTIGNLAFYGCSNLTSIVIPDSVTFIDEEAFGYCENLTLIKYRGSQVQWNDILKADLWDSQAGDYSIEYNYTGE